MIRGNGFLINPNQSPNRQRQRNTNFFYNFHRLAFLNNSTTSASRFGNFCFSASFPGKSKTSAGLSLLCSLDKTAFKRRLTLFRSTAFGKTFFGIIKPKRGTFWLEEFLTLIRSHWFWKLLLERNWAKSASDFSKDSLGMFIN